jgi:hypothetical protein
MLVPTRNRRFVKFLALFCVVAWFLGYRASAQDEGVPSPGRAAPGFSIDDLRARWANNFSR